MSPLSAYRSCHIRRALGAAACVSAGALPGAPSAAATSVQALPTAPARGPVVVAPGVTYQRVADGGRVLHVVRTRPGVAGLAPLLPGGSVSSTGSLLNAVAARQATVVAAVNGDFFNLSASYPSGMTVIDNRLMSEPEPSRSALVIGADGRLSAGRFTLAGSWQTVAPDGTPVGAVRRVPGLNRPGERPSEMLLYTPDYGRVTPAGPSRNEAVVRLDQGAPGIAAVGSVTGTVVGLDDSGGTAVPPNGVVITGLGSQRASVVSDLPLGQRVRIDTSVGGFPAGAQAVGGGPLLVDEGAPVPSASEGFTLSQVTQATSRTAVGQLRDGGYILVTTEGGAQGSDGVTAADQARIMARFGARLAVAMDAGGSAQMVVDDWPVVAWSSPRPVVTAVALTYPGVRIAPVTPRVTPNSDRVDDRATARVTAPGPGMLSVALVPRKGGDAIPLARTQVEGGPVKVAIDPGRKRAPDGPYRLAAEFTPAAGGAATTASRRMVVDRTLAALTARPFRLKARRATPRPSVAVGFRLFRRARVTLRIENAAGRPVRVLAAGRWMPAGNRRVVWDRFVGRRIAQGRVRIVAIARSSYGTSGLVATVDLPKAAPAKKRRRG